MNPEEEVKEQEVQAQPRRKGGAVVIVRRDKGTYSGYFVDSKNKRWFPSILYDNPHLKNKCSLCGRAITPLEDRILIGHPVSRIVCDACFWADSEELKKALEDVYAFRVDCMKQEGFLA